MTATPIYDAMMRGRRFSNPYYVFQHAGNSWDQRMQAIRYSYAFAARPPTSLSQFVEAARALAS